jgi:hypothetical protein
MKDYFESKLEFINTETREIKPDPKFTLLRLGVISYYETFQASDDRYLKPYFEGGIPTVYIWHEYILKNYSSIKYIHLFFEQYISEILLNVSPLLVYGKLNKEIDLINAITNKWDKISTKGRKVGYRQLLIRMCELIRNDEELKENFRVPSEYHFIEKHEEGLISLSILRNEIIHSADKILPMYVYEYFMVNKVIPLIRDVLNLDREILNRNNFSNLSTIEELSKITLPPVEELPLNLEVIQNTLNRIFHLKELGRATAKNPLIMDKYVGESNYTFVEKHNAPKIKIAEYEATFKKENQKGIDKIYNCPCCGAKALITYNLWEYFEENIAVAESAKCLLCTYKIRREIGEPHDFGLKCDKLYHKYEINKADNNVENDNVS